MLFSHNQKQKQDCPHATHVGNPASALSDADAIITCPSDRVPGEDADRVQSLRFFAVARSAVHQDVASFENRDNINVEGLDLQPRA